MSRKRLFGLTADEWLDLASGDGCEVGPCCGNISQLREGLQVIASSQEETTAWLFAPEVLNDYETALAGHDTLADMHRFPLLHRVLGALHELRSRHGGQA